MTNAVWDKIIYELNGTCEMLSQVLEDNNVPELEDDTDFLLYVDERIFCCDCCGWWYDISEVAEDNTCDNCYEYEDNE